MDTFARDWTFRSAAITVRYPAGYCGTLPAHIQLAARKDRALVPPQLGKRNGDNGNGEPARRKGRARKDEGE